MSTFTTWSIVEREIARARTFRDGDEYAPDDAPFARVVEYRTPEGQVCWGVTFVGERDLTRYDAETAFIRHPRVIFP